MPRDFTSEELKNQFKRVKRLFGDSARGLEILQNTKILLKSAQ